MGSYIPRGGEREAHPVPQALAQPWEQLGHPVPRGSELAAYELGVSFFFKGSGSLTKIIQTKNQLSQFF